MTALQPSNKWHWIEVPGKLKAVAYREHGLWHWVAIPGWVTPKPDTKGLVTGFLFDDSDLQIGLPVEVHYSVERHASSSARETGYEKHELYIDQKCILRETVRCFAHVPKPISIDELDDEYLVTITAPTRLMSDLSRNILERKVIHLARWNVTIHRVDFPVSDDWYVGVTSASGGDDDDLQRAVAWSLAELGYRSKPLGFAPPVVPDDIDVLIQRRPPVGNINRTDSEREGSIDATLPRPDKLWHMRAGRFLPDGLLMADDEFESDSLSDIMEALGYFIVEAYKK